MSEDDNVPMQYGGYTNLTWGGWYQQAELKAKPAHHKRWAGGESNQGPVLGEGLPDTSDKWVRAIRLRAS